MWALLIVNQSGLETTKRAHVGMTKHSALYLEMMIAGPSRAAMSIPGNYQFCF